MTEPLVETCSGLVRGLVEKTTDGFEYCAFKGIPYAAPPVGELRFKDPVPARKWSGVRDATKYGPICLQFDPVSRAQGDAEDCLHLNVFVNSIGDANARKAVMVWVHGGGFYFGCGNDVFYGPDYLVRKDIVLVTINYRLGVFGFLDLEDEVAPGNQGLKDQVMALIWVRHNIEKFGGDRNNVTVFGESAGGASAHYLSLSPLAKGFLHKAISQSGVAVNGWASTNNPRKNALELCSILGKPLTDSKAIVEFLRTVDGKKLHEAQEKIYKATGSLPFGPGVDAKSTHPFMPVPIDELAQKGVQVPYLLGYNSREGKFFLLDEFSFSGVSMEDTFKAIDQNFNLLLRFGSVKILNRYGLTPNQFRRLYYKSEKVSLDNVDVYVDIASDMNFIDGIHRIVKIQAERSPAPTYLYQLSYDSGFSVVESLSSVKVSGSGHFDEISYLFKMQLYDQLGVPHLKKGTQSYRIMEQMTELWTNFAKYGRPTIETSELIPTLWQPLADGNVLRYLNIDEDITMQSTLNIENKFMSAKSIRK